MNKEAVGTYLTDHLGGAAAGLDLARRICSESEGTPLGDDMSVVAREIEEDRETLRRYVDGLDDVHRNPLKEAAGAAAEKLTRVKLGGDDSHGRLMALETLAMGIAGKVAMWRALDAAMKGGVDLPPLDTPSLIGRGNSQLERVERRRLEAAFEAFSTPANGTRRPAR